MKKIYMIGLILTLPLSLMAQQPFQFSQYFQNAFTINPAVTGAEEFLDIKLGYRQQLSGVDGAPETYFLSAHSALSKQDKTFPYQQNSLRISDPDLYSRFENSGRYRRSHLFHHGLGGYVANDRQGIFKQTSGFLSYALHVSVGTQTTLSLGVAGGLNSRAIDVSNINLGETDVIDPTYQAYLARQGRTTSFDMNAGLFLYAKKFYIGYSAVRILQNEIYSDVQSISGKQRISHYGLVGLRLQAGPRVMVLPGALVRYDAATPLLYDVNVRFKFEDLAWIGASYRNTQTLAGMAGVSLSDFLNLSYSYDYGLGDVNNFSTNVHEIVLGLMLFNKKEAAPYLW